MSYGAQKLARVMGEDSADNIGSTSNVTANNDGSLLERLEAVQQGLPLGKAFWVKKTLTSSEIPQTGVDVTGASSGGDMEIQDVVVKSDATGLAAMTNFTLETDNSKGAALFFSTAASGLGASATIDLANASVTKKKTILESGKKVIAKATAADGTGAGTVDVWIKFRRIAMGATIAAAA